MKSTIFSISLKIGAIFGVLLLGSGSSAAGQEKILYLQAAKLSATAITSNPQGYLQVYSATDLFNNGDSSYFPHSSYVIYSKDGKVFRNIENHISRDDEIPTRVSLPVGTYLVEARSEEEGYVRIPVAIKEGAQSTLHLDLRRVR